VLPQLVAGDDPLFRHVRTQVRSPQANGVVERFFGTLKYEHLHRATFGDGNALAVEVNLFRHLQHSATPPCPRRTHTTRGLPRRRTLRLACGLWRTRYLTGRS
jgi:transposase InsO family protein